MSSRNKPQVGRTVYVADARVGEPSAKLVTKVGRLYFYVGCARFRIDNWIEEVTYGAPRRAYASMGDWEDAQERRSLLLKLRGDLGYGGRLDQADLAALRKIDSVLGGVAR